MRRCIFTLPRLVKSCRLIRWTTSPIPTPIVQRLTALIPEILAKPDIASRLEDVQTLPRKTLVLGDEFPKLIRAQINTWMQVAKRAKVEVIT